MDITANLLTLIKNLPISGIIPNYEKVRPLLYELFAIETGPACMLITHYYITGKMKNPNDFLYDPADQTKWCISNLVYFSRTAKKLRNVRNVLVHNNYFPMELLNDTTKALIDLSQKNKNDLLNILITKIYNIYIHLNNDETNMIDDNSNIKDLITQCPLCGSLVSRLNNISNDNKKINDIEYQQNTLKYYKENGYKDILKGKKVKIIQYNHDGVEFYKDKIGIFRCWAGTVVYIEFEELGRKAIRVNDTIISIL